MFLCKADLVPKPKLVDPSAEDPKKASHTVQLRIGENMKIWYVSDMGSVQGVGSHIQDISLFFVFFFELVSGVLSQNEICKREKHIRVYECERRPTKGQWKGQDFS